MIVIVQQTMKNVSIEGNICSGKSTYIKLLRENSENHINLIERGYHPHMSNTQIDIIIYLSCNPSVCSERSTQKGTPITYELLKHNHIVYETMCDDIVRDNKLSLYKVNSQDDIQTTLACIQDILREMKPLNPIGPTGGYPKKIDS